MDIATARRTFAETLINRGWSRVGTARGIVTWESPNGEQWGIASYDRDGDTVIDMQVRLINRHSLAPTGQVLLLDEI